MNNDSRKLKDYRFTSLSFSCFPYISWWNLPFSFLVLIITFELLNSNKYTPSHFDKGQDFEKMDIMGVNLRYPYDWLTTGSV